MNYQNQLTLTLSLLLLPLGVLAQNVVTGTITEASSNSPLPGVNIIEKRD